MKMDTAGLLLSGDDKRVVVPGLNSLSASGVHKALPLLCKLASWSSVQKLFTKGSVSQLAESPLKQLLRLLFLLTSMSVDLVILKRELC